MPIFQKEKIDWPVESKWRIFFLAREKKLHLVVANLQLQLEVSYLKEEVLTC